MIGVYGDNRSMSCSNFYVLTSLLNPKPIPTSPGANKEMVKDGQAR